MRRYASSAYSHERPRNHAASGCSSPARRTRSRNSPWRSRRCRRASGWPVDDRSARKWIRTHWSSAAQDQSRTGPGDTSGSFRTAAAWTTESGSEAAPTSATSFCQVGWSGSNSRPRPAACRYQVVHSRYAVSIGHRGESRPSFGESPLRREIRSIRNHRPQPTSVRAVCPARQSSASASLYTIRIDREMLLRSKPSSQPDPRSVGQLAATSSSSAGSAGRTSSGTKTASMTWLKADAAASSSASLG